MVGYLFVLAYLAVDATYWTAVAMVVVLVSARSSTDRAPRLLGGRTV